MDGEQPHPAGLSVGTPVPPFELSDFTGRIVHLEDFSGQEVFLIHWSPRCDFCTLIAPDLSRAQADFRKRDVALVLVSQGDVESNRRIAQEYGLDCPILLQSAAKPVEVFRGVGTPVAYLLDGQGRVARSVAVGAEQVRTMTAEVVTAPSSQKRLPTERPLSESRLVREGLRAGTPAPSFSLPDIHGQTVSLQDYRGRQVLLVFTDPGCGPCDELVPHLTRLHRQHGDARMVIVMVSRGDPTENRRMARAHGVEFPVALQRWWELSKQYGIFATPVAFLVGEDGILQRNVARGVHEIRALAHEALAARKGGES